MKKRKKEFKTLAMREGVKRRDKRKSISELKRLVESVGVSYEGARFADVFEPGGKREGKAHVAGREERIIGLFSGSRRGFGFVVREGERDVFIPEDKTSGAIDGDTVEAVFHTFKNRFGEEKTEGKITKIIEIGKRNIVGTLRKVRRGFGKKSTFVYIIEPKNMKMAENIEVMDTLDAYDGDMVEARLSRHGRYVTASVIKCLGPSENFGANYMAALAESGIEVDFSPEALTLANRVSAAAVTTEGRRDLRDEIIFTIDGAGAKDLDDAISLKRVKGGYKLGVHIADVSYYVAEKSALERAAMARATSVYFIDKVVPMLPEALSNGACSLNAGEDKYAISAIIKLDGEGNILSCEIVPSVIRSCVRGVYSEVNELFLGTAGEEIKEKYNRVTPILMKMRELYLKLSEKSKKRGAIELETAEAYIRLDEDGMPTEIVKAQRGEGEKLIEQFMLTANEAVATKLTELSVPCVYRIHESPPEDKLDNLLIYLSNLGFNVTGIRTAGGVNVHALGKVIEQSFERGIERQTSYAILRAMSKAKYSEHHSAHFGLSIPLYCHFTSPIRRLSDLATHRIIRRVLFEGKAAGAYSAYARRAAAAASDGELRALTAERKIEDMYKALYLSLRVGERFSATVSSVTAFGMFCELENTCEGLIPINDLGAEFFFDEKNLSLRSHNKVYRLGDSVDIVVEECDVNEGKVRFSLA